MTRIAFAKRNVTQEKDTCACVRSAKKERAKFRMANNMANFLQIRI